jgi:hypothetical protein
VTVEMLYDHERIRGSVTRMVNISDGPGIHGGNRKLLVGGASDPLSKKRLKKELRN